MVATQSCWSLLLIEVKRFFFAADIFYRLYKGFAQNLNKRGPFWDQFKSE